MGDSRSRSPGFLGWLLARGRVEFACRWSRLWNAGSHHSRLERWSEGRPAFHPCLLRTEWNRVWAIAGLAQAPGQNQDAGTIFRQRHWNRMLARNHPRSTEAEPLQHRLAFVQCMRTTALRLNATGAPLDPKPAPPVFGCGPAVKVRTLDCLSTLSVDVRHCMQEKK